MLDATTLLAVNGLQAWYGESHILHGVTFDVRAGEVVTLLGRNGAGKTTTMKSIMGIVGKRKGSVRFENAETIALTSDKIARLGIALCPEERAIFSGLDVKENLMLPPEVKPGGLSVETIFGAALPTRCSRFFQSWLDGSERSACSMMDQSTSSSFASSRRASNSS